MWTALILVVLAVVAGAALVARAVVEDRFGETPDDELWLRDASWWL